MKFLFPSMCFLSAAAFAAPTVTVKSVAQDPVAKTVVVTYDLSEDAIVTMDVLKDGASIGASNIDYVTGDAFRKVAGATDRTIIWAAEKSWPGHSTEDITVELTAWELSAPPPYMVVSLGKFRECAYYPSAEALPGGGLANDAYRTEKLVMRKIPAAKVTWRMGKVGGSGYTMPRKVTFTQDYYMSVFEVTQGQCFRLLHQTYSANTEVADAALRPADQVSYGRARGGYMTQSSGWKEVDGDGAWWPSDDKVGSESIVGALRTMTGLHFDLPTSAQWEYACRAGNPDETFDADFDKIGWYEANAHEVTQVVGTKKPNAWGLYDMFGNVAEHMLDRTYPDGYLKDEMTDPVGPTLAECGYVNSYGRLIRGGAVNSAGFSASAVTSNLNSYYNPLKLCGVRLACPCPAE